MSIDPRLVQAYKAAEYALLTEPEIVIRVGEHNVDVDMVLRADDAESAAFVTASNPSSVEIDEDDNMIAFAALAEALDDQGYNCYRGEGRDPRGQWPVEQSLLVVGIGRDEAEQLGKRLQQNAIVFIELGKPPQLLLLK
jgi:hypothetical protein